MSNPPPSASLPRPGPPDAVAQALEAEGKLAPAIGYTGPNTEEPVPAPKSLGHRTSVGILWLMVQTLGNRLVGIGSQVILAWLLRPGDFGLIGMAYTVTSFTSVLVNPGLDQILVHRQRHFRLWANPAFWMSLTFALVAVVILAALAPLAARFYHEPALKGLILIIAASSLFTSAALVPSTALLSQLRFKLIALVGMVANFAGALLTIIFAYFGFKAYSFVLPTLILSVVILGFYWTVARVPIRPHPQWRRWRFLVTDSVYVILTRIMQTVVAQGDYITVGYFYHKDVLGVYFFAFNLSTLVFRVLAGNVINVLFPALAQIQRNIDHLFASAFRAATLLATMAVPVAMLQVLLANPGLHLLFNSRWWDAVPLVQILSIGPVINVICWPMGSLLQAQGRFKETFWLWVSNAVFFALLIVPLVRYDQARGAAIANLIFYVVTSFTGFGVTVWGRNPWWHLLKVGATPLLAGVIAAAASWGAQLGLALLARPRLAMSLELPVVPLVFFLVYIVTVRLIDRALWLEIHGRISALVASRK